MTSKVDSDLKKQIINEVSRVHSSNLKRVESSSGMKTIFSSDDYNNKKSQPKPTFQRGNRGHQTPQSPGRNRIRLKHNEHKGISADLFEKHSPLNSKEAQSKNIHADFVSAGISFTDNPLATSTLKPDTSTYNHTLGTTGVNGIISNNRTDLSHQQTVIQRSEESQANEHNENKTIRVTSQVNDDSVSSKSSFTKSYKEYSGKCTIPASVRDEAEMSLPDSSIRQSDEMTATESNMTEEDHAIQSLLNLAEGQEAEMNQLENRNSQSYNTELSKSLSNHIEDMSEVIYDRSVLLRQEPGRSGLNGNTVDKSTDEEAKNMDEDNTYFDLKELISSTPQTGSMHEDTTSEIDSVNSGTGQRLDRLDNLHSKDISIEATAELKYKQDSPSHSHTSIKSSSVNSANTEIYLNSNNAEIFQHESGVFSQNGDRVLTDSHLKRDSDEPSQEDIDDTHRRFDQILADMSTSFEEDLKMEEKSVSGNMTSEADVVVHTTPDDYNMSRNVNGESDFAQEFTDLESSVITTGVDSLANNSTLADMKNGSDRQTNKDYSVLELSRLHAKSQESWVSADSMDSNHIENFIETKTEVENPEPTNDVTERVSMETEESGRDSGILLKSSNEQNTSLDVLDFNNTSLQMRFDSTSGDVNKEASIDTGEGSLELRNETVTQASTTKADYETFSDTHEINLYNEVTSDSSDQHGSPRDPNISEASDQHGSPRDLNISEASDQHGRPRDLNISEASDQHGSPRNLNISEASDQHGSPRDPNISEASDQHGSPRDPNISEASDKHGSPRDPNISEASDQHGSPRDLNISEASDQHGSPRDLNISEASDQHGSPRDLNISEASDQHGSPRDPNISEASDKHGSPRDPNISEASDQHGSPRDLNISEASDQHGSSRDPNISEASDQHGSPRDLNISEASDQHGSPRDLNISEASDQHGSPIYLNISEDAQKPKVYSEAYENEQIDGSYKTSLSESESSRLYETIGDDDVSRADQDLSNKTEKEADISIDKGETSSEKSSTKLTSFSTGRLSPIGAEAGDRKVESTATSIVTSTAQNTRPQPAVKNTPPVISGSFLSRLKAGPMKSKSDFQTLSETVNVKGLAKQLEKSLDFSKMVRNPKTTDNVEETKSEPKKQAPKIKTVDKQNPKAAFGLVLSEIFKKNKQINIEDGNTVDKPYKAYHLRPTSPPPTSTNIIDTDRRGEENVITQKTIDQTAKNEKRNEKTVIIQTNEETAKNEKRSEEAFNTNKSIEQTVNASKNSTVTNSSDHQNSWDDVTSRDVTDSSYKFITVAKEDRKSDTSSAEDEVATEAYDVEIFNTNSLNDDKSPPVTTSIVTSSHERYLSHNTSFEGNNKPSLIDGSYTRDDKQSTNRDEADDNIISSTNNIASYNDDERIDATNSSLLVANHDILSNSERLFNTGDASKNESTRFSNSSLKIMTTGKEDETRQLSTSFDAQGISDSEQDESFVSITTLTDNENNLSDLETDNETQKSPAEEQFELNATNFDRNSQEVMDYTYKRDSVNSAHYDVKLDRVNKSQYGNFPDSLAQTDYGNKRDTVNINAYDMNHGSVTRADYRNQRDIIKVTNHNNFHGQVNVLDNGLEANSNLFTDSYSKQDLLPSVTNYKNQDKHLSDYNNGQVNADTDYDNHRDRSLNSSMSDETYTSTHEEFLVPVPRSENIEAPKRELSERELVEHVVSDTEVIERVKPHDYAFPSYRERFFEQSSDERNIVTTHGSLVSTKTFHHEPGDLNVSESGEVHFDSSVKNKLHKQAGSDVNPITWAFQEQTAQNETDLADRDTVQGSSARPALNSVHLDYSLYSSALGNSEKPAKQLHGSNINNVKNEDRSDHVTGSSSSQPVYVIGDVTREWDKTEEFVTSSEKLSESAYSSNCTSDPKPSRPGHPAFDNNHSLFYDSSVEDDSGINYESHLTPPSSRYITGGNKHKKGSMAYLLTGKERATADYNRSGRSTPQRKDLYVEEDILVSPTAVDERRGSHTSRDYLTDNHGEQNFFHFNMNSPSNYDREGTEVRVESIQHVERSKRKPVKSEPQQFEPLPDTYIGTAKAPERVPIRIETHERRPVEVSQSSSKAYLIENESPNYRTSIAVTDSKPSEQTRTEKRTSTTYTSSQKHNGTNGNHITSDHMGYPQQSNVIRIKTHSTGPESSRRDRRDVHMTSRVVSGKHQADDNISISSLSSQSSTSDHNRSHEMSGSKIHHRIDNRRIDNTRRVQQVNSEYISDGRIHSSADTMPNHVKSSSKTRVYNSGKIDGGTRFHPDQDNRSTQDVQYLIKSLEKDTKQPGRPIPGMVGDAFSYHVTSSGKENKSSSRNNQVNEVDVTTREAMLDRESKGKGSSHIIRRYKEERTVEDVNPNSAVHLSVEPNQSNRTILLQNGQRSDRPIVFHPPSSLGRSDSERTSTYERSGPARRQEGVKSPETTYYVDSSGSHSGKVRSEKIRLVNKEKKHHKGHSVSSDDNSSDDEGGKRRAPKSGKVSTVLYDFSSNHQPSLANVVHLEGAQKLTPKDRARSQDIYSIPRNTDKPYRARSSSESSMSDHGHHKKGTVVTKAKSDQVHRTHDQNRSHPRGYKSENVFYEHYEVKRDNPMYQDSDKIVYVSPRSKHDTRNSSKEIYIDSKSHSPTRHQLSSSFSSVSPTGSPTPDDKHVTTVSFDESFNRKRSASPVSTTYAYKPKTHVKKHRVVKTDEHIIRPAESDNELYVRGSRASPYRVVVKGDKHRGGKYSDTDESFYSDSRTSGSHRSTINISKAGGKRPDPDVPAVMSIPLTSEPVAMTIPAIHETKYVTNKSERMELKRSASMDSIRDMVDYPADRSFRSDKMLQFNNSSETHSSPDMKSPNSPYVSTITILNRKLNVDPATTTEVISSDDDIRYRSQLNPVKEEVVYATKEAPRETKQQHRSEKHTTYTTYEEYRDTDNFEYVVPSQTKTTTIRQERQIPIREEHIRPVREDRAKAVRESLHEKFTNMNYEQSQEPHQVEQKSSSDLKVVRGQFVIRNSMDIDLEEGDSLTLDDNINVFDNSFTMNKENPLYQSDPDIYNKFESETVEQRTQRIRAPVHGQGTGLSRDEVDAYRADQAHIYHRNPYNPTHTRLHYDSHDLDVPYAEGDFGDGFEDIIQNTRQAAVKSAPNKKKQNLSQLLLSKLAQIDSKDITQHIDVEHHNEEIYGDIKFIHADGSKSEAVDTTNFDSVSEHIDLMLKEGKALITIKVTAERIIPVDYEFNVWRKSQAIVTRNIEIDLKANDQRRRLYEHVMETTPRKMIGTSSTGYEEANEAVLSSRDTLKLFSRLLSVAEKDEKAVERDEVTYETQHRERSDSLPSLSNADMLY